jgi:leader peptidase (prepilin peptidase) / N-methyltransferase
LRFTLRLRPLEFGSALLFASVGAVGVLALVDAVFAIGFAALTLWLVKSDLDAFQLPDVANFAVAALGSAWIATLADPAAGLLQAALRALAAAACLSAVKWCYARVRRLEGLGWGDVKLAAAGAVWLDWPQLPIALLVAAVAGILVVARHAIVAPSPSGAIIAIPFGAFLAPAIWLVWLVGRADLF